LSERADLDGAVVLNIHHPPPEDAELRARLGELSERIDEYTAQLDRPRRLQRRTEDLVDSIGSTDPRIQERILGRMSGLREGVSGAPDAVTAVNVAVTAVQRVLDRRSPDHRSHG
jgi:hypothetical protein